MEGVSILREESLALVHFLVSGRWKDFGGKGKGSSMHAYIIQRS